MKNTRLLLLVFLAGIGIGLFGCNDSGTDSEPSVMTQLSGTVSDGEPVANAVVTAVNSQGESAEPVNVNTDGAYTLFVNEGAPYMLKAYSEEDGIELYSYADENTTANITPLTNLALFVAAGYEKALNDVYRTWSSNPLPADDVKTAAKLVNANFVGVYRAHHVDAGTYNFFKTAFTMDGHGIDGVLDDLEITIDAEAPTMDTLVGIVASGDKQIIFDPYTDISNFFLIDRITPTDTFEKLSGGNALLVCSYGDEACGKIMIEHTMLKSELEAEMSSLPKSQEIIFY